MLPAMGSSLLLGRTGAFGCTLEGARHGGPGGVGAGARGAVTVTMFPPIERSPPDDADPCTALVVFPVEELVTVTPALPTKLKMSRIDSESDVILLCNKTQLAFTGFSKAVL